MHAVFQWLKLQGGKVRFSELVSVRSNYACEYFDMGIVLRGVWLPTL